MDYSLRVGSLHGSRQLVSYLKGSSCQGFVFTGWLRMLMDFGQRRRCAKLMNGVVLANCWLNLECQSMVIVR